MNDNNIDYAPGTVQLGDMVLRLMAVVEKHPGFIEEWLAGNMHLMISTDGVRLLGSGDLVGDMGPAFDGSES